MNKVKRMMTVGAASALSLIVIIPAFADWSGAIRVTLPPHGEGVFPDRSAEKVTDEKWFATYGKQVNNLLPVYCRGLVGEEFVTDWTAVKEDQSVYPDLFTGF